MEVTGLPAAVRTSLEALLAENELSSWKIASEGNTTVIVLRLTTPHQTSNGGRTTVYKKKTPCQIRRDRRRAEQRAAQRQESHLTTKKQASAELNVQSSAKTNSYAKTSCIANRRADILSEKQYTETNSDNGPRHDILPLAAREIRGALYPSSVLLDSSECGSVGELSCDTDNNNTDQHGVMLGACADSSFPSENEDFLFTLDTQHIDPKHLIEAESVAENAGHSVHAIRNKVGEVFDKQKQTQLRDQCRNLSLKKVVMDSGNKDILYCESDDLMVVYDCARQSVTHWYIEHCSRGKLWSPTELKAWNHLHREPPLEADQRADVRETVKQDLLIIGAAIRASLG